MEIGRIDVDEQRAQLPNALSRLLRAVAQGGRDLRTGVAVDAIGGGRKGIGGPARSCTTSSWRSLAMRRRSVSEAASARQQERLALLAVVVQRARHAVGERQREQLEQQQRSDSAGANASHVRWAVSVTDALRG